MSVFKKKREIYFSLFFKNRHFLNRRSPMVWRFRKRLGRPFRPNRSPRTRCDFWSQMVFWSKKPCLNIPTKTHPSEWRNLSLNPMEFATIAPCPPETMIKRLFDQKPPSRIRRVESAPGKRNLWLKWWKNKTHEETTSIIVSGGQGGFLELK